MLHENSRKIKGLLSDTQIVLASDEILVLEHSYEDNAENINNQLTEIEKLFNAYNKSNYKLICISTKKWKKETERFIENKSNNIKYIKQEEPEIHKDIELNDVFLNDKIEIV